MGLSLRKLGSRIFDQVNPFDNGRTYQQRTPTNNRSVVQQAVNSGASNVAQGVARNAVRAYPQAVKSVGRVIAPVTPVDDIVRGVGNLSEEVANAVPEISPTSPARFLNSLAIRPYKTTQGNFGQALQGQNPYEGSARQQAGQFTQDVINASSVLPVGKAASLATKGAPLGIKVLQGAKLGAKMGGGFGAAQGVSTSLQDELSIPEALKTTAVNTVAGTALGAGLGVAAPVGGKVISVGAKGALKGAKVSAKATQDAIQAVRATQTPLNEVGGIGKDVRTAKYNNKNVEMVPTDELLKYREHDRTTVYGGSGMSDKQYAELKADIAKNGIKAPLGLSYNAKDRTAYLGEGNHRLAIARELGIKELPVEVQGVMSNSLVGKAVKVSGRAPDEFGYVPSNQRPSDIGVKTSPRLRNPLRPLNEGGYVRLPSGEQVDKPLYHGSPVADQIRQEGFKQAPVRNGNLYGEGTYLTTSRSTAKDYADVGKNVVRADVPKNAKVLRVNSMETQNIDVPTLKKQGYDGIEIADGPQHNNIVMFDPKKITPVKERAKIKKISNLNDNEMNDLTPSVIDYWKNQGFSGVSNGKRTVKFNVANKLGLKKLNEGGTLGDNNQPTIKNIFGEEVPNPAYKGVDPLDSLRQEASKYKSAEEFVKAQTNLYHGTKADFSEFDPNLLGTNTGAPSAKKGFFFTDNEQLANHYANPGRNQGTAISKNLEDAMGRAVERAKKEGLDNSLSNNTGGAMVVGSWPKTAKATEVKSSILSKMETLKSRFDSPEDIKKINRFQQLVTEELDNTKLTDLELSGKVLKSKVNLENPMVFDDNGLRNGASYAKRIDEAIAKGHDGVIIKNTQDPFRGDIHVAFDKNQILTEKQLTDLYNQAQPTKNKLGLKKLNEGGFVANPFNKDGSLRSGVKKDQIFDGVDGKPRVEFNDSGAKTNTNNLDALNRPNELAFSRQALNMGVIMKTVDEPTAIKRLGEIDKLISSAKKEATKAKKTTLSNVLEHPELYKQYPELQNMPVEFVKNRNNGLLAGYDPAKDRILINANKVHVGDNYKKSLLHEIQHAIQEREGFAAGGDVRWKDYNNLAGEAEARAVAERINMTPAERAKIPFNNSLDVPKEDLIMRNSDGTAMSIDKTTKPAQSKVPKASQLPKVALKQETAPQAPVPENNLVDSLPNNNTTKKVGEKTRGFQENIQRTLPDQPTAQAVIEAMPGYKPITNKGSLKKASDAIAENPQGEYARIITKNQLDSADDVVSGNLLLRDAIEAGDTETAIQLGTKLGIDGTKLGQAIQAYATFKKTTPEGIITYASKQARSKGNELDAITAKELTDKANAIAAMPESFEKAKLRKEMLQQADELGRSWTDVAGEVLNVPRAAMATADFSAPLRQGAILGSRFPAQFGKAFAESAKYMFKPDYYEKAMYDLTQRPTYSLMKSRKLSVDAGENLTGTEEQFLNNILEADFFKKIGVGHVVAASDRAYSGFLTKIRADVFDKVLADSNKAGVQLGNKELDSLAKYINSASGRGSGNVTNQVSRLQVLFSARLWKSRLDVLNPAYYARLDPTARKYALQSAASFAGIATTLISLAAAGGADVSADPRSADFGKIKVGNTRYDVLSGLQQNIRLAAQLISGEKVNSETGEVQTLGPERGFGKPSRLDILYQFVENKENPAIAFATKALRGTDPTGKPINLASEAAKLTIPLTAQGAYSTVKDTGSVGKGIAMNLPGVFGVGVQTYGDNKTKDKVAGGSSPDDQTPAQGKVAIKKASGDGYGLNRLSDGKYAYKFEGDDKIYTTKNLKDARDALSKDRLAKSGDNIKVVGDTVYRKNSEGKVTEMPKIKYDYQVGTATMTAQKNAGDLDGYVKTAQSQLANIDKQLKDPTTDPLEAAKLRNQATSLQKSISKYSGYGGFAKGKSGGRSRGSRGGGGGSSSPEAESAYKYAIKLKSSGAIPKPKVKAVASKKVKASGKVGKIKVSSKKSLV